MKHRKAGLTLSLMVLLLGSRVGASPLEPIDKHARNAPSRVTKNVADLAAYLVKPAKNDLEKVRGFYVWIAENIAYDVQAFRHYRPGRYQKVPPDEVLKRRTAVCQGYAELFQAMCYLTDIPCYLVPGYSKGFATRNQDFTQADHAWNAVKINDQWQLLDVTWGSGGINEQFAFVKEFNDDYFLSRPEVFIKDHMPIDPIWQLLVCSVSMTSFIKGGEALQNEVASSSPPCEDMSAILSEFEQSEPKERELFSAQRAYDFNPTNSLVLVRAYMNQSHQLMSNIPEQLRSRTAIESAVATQEEALGYLEKAKALLDGIRNDKAKLEKKMLKINWETSMNNLKGLKQALQ